MILKHGLLFLIIFSFIVISFENNVFAEEIVIQKNPIGIDANGSGSMIKTETVSSDGSVWIFLTATQPVEKERMTINLRFTDKDGEQINDINYDIIATQNGNVVLEDIMVNQRVGIGDHRTQTLPNNDNVNIRITLQGFGTNPPFTGPHGDLSPIEEIPEFGSISIIILTVAIISVVGISAKSRYAMINCR